MAGITRLWIRSRIARTIERYGVTIRPAAQLFEASRFDEGQIDQIRHDPQLEVRAVRHTQRGGARRQSKSSAPLPA